MDRGRTDGQMDGRTDGRTEGRTDGRTDGWIRRCSTILGVAFEVLVGVDLGRRVAVQMRRAVV
jgi:hypothetical protein